MIDPLSISRSVEVIKPFFSQNVLGCGLVMDARKPFPRKPVDFLWQLVKKGLFAQCHLSLFVKLGSMDGSHSPREMTELVFSQSVFGKIVMVYECTMFHISNPLARDNLDFPNVWSVGNSTVKYHHTSSFLKALCLLSLHATNVIHGLITAISQRVQVTELFFSQNVFGCGLVMDAQTRQPLSRKPVDSHRQLMDKGVFDHCNLSLIVKVVCLDWSMHGLDIGSLLNRNHGPKEITELLFSQSLFGYGLMINECTMFHISNPSAREHLDFAYVWSVSKSTVEHHHTSSFQKALYLFSPQATNVIHDLITAISQSVDVTEQSEYVWLWFGGGCTNWKAITKETVESIWQIVEDGQCHLSFFLKVDSMDLCIVFSVPDIAPLLNKHLTARETTELLFNQSVFGYDVMIYRYRMLYIKKPSVQKQLEVYIQSAVKCLLHLYHPFSSIMYFIQSTDVVEPIVTVIDFSLQEEIEMLFSQSGFGCSVMYGIRRIKLKEKPLDCICTWLVEKGLLDHYHPNTTLKESLFYLVQTSDACPGLPDTVLILILSVSHYSLKLTTLLYSESLFGYASDIVGKSLSNPSAFLKEQSVKPYHGFLQPFLPCLFNINRNQQEVCARELLIIHILLCGHIENPLARKTLYSVYAGTVEKYNHSCPSYMFLMKSSTGKYKSLFRPIVALVLCVTGVIAPYFLLRKQFNYALQESSSGLESYHNSKPIYCISGQSLESYHNSKPIYCVSGQSQHKSCGMYLKSGNNCLIQISSLEDDITVNLCSRRKQFIGLQESISGLESYHNSKPIYCISGQSLESAQNSKPIYCISGQSQHKSCGMYLKSGNNCLIQISSLEDDIIINLCSRNGLLDGNIHYRNHYSKLNTPFSLLEVSNQIEHKLRKICKQQLQTVIVNVPTNDLLLIHNYIGTIVRLLQEQLKEHFTFKIVKGDNSSDAPIVIHRFHQNDAFVVGISYHSLYYAEKEASYVSHSLQCNGVLGKDATIGTLTSRMKHAPILHLAVHMSHDGDFMPLDSNLNEGFSQQDLESCGDLGHMVLVVLNGCKSGKGQLYRAFINSGAQAIVATDSIINDEAAFTIMKFFYQYLQDGFYGSKALHKAMVSLCCIEKYSQPEQWSTYWYMGREIVIEDDINVPLLTSLGNSSVFPQLNVIEELESAFLKEVRQLPSSVQVMKKLYGRCNMYRLHTEV